MSPECWKRRLAKRGIALTVYDRSHMLGDVTQEWTVFVEPTDRSRSDPRFRPLIGIAIHQSRDEAVRIAVADFERAEAEQLREKVVLALAGLGA